LDAARFKLKDNKIWLEKIGWIKIVQDRAIPEDAKFVNVTVSRNKDGRFYASILVEETVQPKPKTGIEIGIDAGLKDLIVTSDELFVENPKYLRKSQAKLSRVQRRMSRKKGSKKGEVPSNRWRKTKSRINKIYQKVKNQRSYFLHNLSSFLVNKYDVISTETLNVIGMLKNHRLAYAISDASWSELFRLLAYKCDWYGKEYRQIDMFEPTSKTCSCCGWKKEDLTLKDRVFECKQCGAVLDRDLNAARNIKALGVNSAIRTVRDKVTSPSETSKTTLENEYALQRHFDFQYSP
jgi:putative transposase